AVVKVVPDKLPRVPKARVVYEYKAPDAPVEKGRNDPMVRSQQRGPAEKSASSVASVRRFPDA
ncbi:MAG TPA: hypothetical protein VF551_01140, partial [Chthoniobacterales bacterium]